MRPLLASVSWTALLTPFLAWAQTPTIHDYDIPPQPVDAALNAFAEQTEFTVLYLSADVEGAVSEGVRGTYDVIRALEVLLDGTDLEFVVEIPARRIRIVRSALARATETEPDETGAPLQSPATQGAASIAAARSQASGTGRVARGPRTALEEVVVTARRYAESLEDAPLAVNVMAAGYLEDQRVYSVQDILELTPGATWGGFTKAQPSFQMRGIDGSAEANTSREAGLSFVIDGIPITRGFMVTPTLFDVQRVEIMRGPQGTTFGRNSTAGLVHFITGRPTTDFESQITVQAGTLNLSGISGFVSGGLNDSLAARLAFNFEETDGPLEDADSGAPLEGFSNRAVRASLLYEPSDNFNAYVKGEITLDDDLPPARRPAVCTRPWLTTDPVRIGSQFSAGFATEYTAPCDRWKSKQSPAPLGGFFTERQMTNLTAELSWNLRNDMTLTWLSGYVEGDHRNLQDNRGTPEVIEEEFVANDGSIRSTELRIDNTRSGNRLTWLAGVYLMMDEESRSEVTYNCPPRGNGCGIARVSLADGSVENLAAPLPGHVLERSARGSTESIGLFGEISYDITDRLNIAIGGRYTDDSRSYSIQADGWGDANELSLLGLGGPRYCADNVVDVNGHEVCGTAATPMGYDTTYANRSWDDFSPKLSLTYAVNADNNVYFQYSEGFRSGGFQADVLYADFLNVARLENEDVASIELGWKGAYDRARFAVTLFSTEQTDAQSNVLFSPIPGARQQINVSANLGGIESEGVEFESEFLLWPGFTLGGNLAIQESIFGPGTIRRAEIDAATGELSGGEDISGMDSGVPETTWVLYGDYTWTLPRGSSLSIRADIQHRDWFWGTSGAANRTALLPDGSGFAAIRPDLDNVGAHVRWSSATGRTSVTLWGKNLKDEQDYIAGVPFTPNGIYYLDPVYGSFNSTRTVWGRKQVGIDATFRF